MRAPLGHLLWGHEQAARRGYVEAGPIAGMLRQLGWKGPLPG